MKRRIVNMALIVAALAFAGCDETGAPVDDPAAAYQGIVINEIAAHDETSDGESWVELLNTSSSDIGLSGVGLYLFDEYFDGKLLTDLDGKSLAAGERIVLSTADEALKTGMASNADFTLVLGTSATEGVLDIFERPSESRQLPCNGSWQRIPDGGEWQSSLTASRGKENVILSFETLKHNAIWLWSTHMGQWLENDNEVMKQVKALGYDHVLLNFSAFDTPSSQPTARKFIAAAADAGIMVHAWMQCFYKGGWIYPVDVENKCYRQDIFDDIVAKANRYIDEFGVQGLHLDYIRFPGTAHKYNVSAEVTGIGAVTECCRQIREAVDAREHDIVLSAALMAEDNAAYYYGQNPAQMGQYIDVLMPMIYRYHEGGTVYGEDWCKRMCRLFTTVTDAQVWAGITTYDYSGSSVSGLSAEEIRSDAEIFLDTDATGIVLFRYALGTFPDVNDLWDNK